MPAKTDHLKVVERASLALQRAQDARDEAVVEALAAGRSLREVSRASGLSVEGVRKIALRLSR